MWPSSGFNFETPVLKCPAYSLSFFSDQTLVGESPMGIKCFSPIPLSQTNQLDQTEKLKRFYSKFKFIKLEQNGS